MEKAIGEVFDYNGVTLTTIENNGYEGCFFNNNNTCTMSSEKVITCSVECRKDNKNVIFKEMEERTIKLTLEKAREFYKKGGEFKDLALSAFTKEELQREVLPKTWKEFCENKKVCYKESYIDYNSNIDTVVTALDMLRKEDSDKNLLPSKQAAEAHLALMQLHQLRDCYRQGWKPDWEKEELKWCIDKRKIYLIITSSYSYNKFLSFQSKEIAQLFLDNFQDLIKQAGDLI